MVQTDSWPTPTTQASRTTKRVLVVPLLEHAGIPYEFVQSGSEQEARR